MFDPSLHTVGEVLAYLADADPEEVGRVLALERRGRARMEILTQFPVSLGGRPPLTPGGDSNGMDR